MLFSPRTPPPGLADRLDAVLGRLPVAGWVPEVPACRAAVVGDPGEGWCPPYDLVPLLEDELEREAAEGRAGRSQADVLVPSEVAPGRRAESRPTRAVLSELAALTDRAAPPGLQVVEAPPGQSAPPDLTAPPGQSALPGLEALPGQSGLSVLGRLRAGRRDPGRRGAFALVAVAVLAAAVAGLVLLRSRPSEQPVTAPAVSRPGAPVSAQATGAVEVVVAVAGRVRRPGLVHLPGGSRVDDAVRAAGGVLPGASVGLVNLARRVVDGELVLIGVAAPPGSVANPGAAGPAAGEAGGPLDLNAATAGELDSLPGIGPVLAERIISWRTEHGGRFLSVDQLRQVSGIGESKYQTLRAKVRV